MEISSSDPDASSHPKTWRVGTLVYNRRGLSNVFALMLWGDFCLNLMDSGVQPTVIPLQLKKYGASMSAIGFLTGTVVEIMSIVMVVVISTWSDRHRGKLGRRMPFMLYTAPPVALLLIAMGFSPEIAGWMQRTVPGMFGTIAMGSMVMGVISVTMIGYRFFDLFPQSVYYYLFADVIPQKVMGKFVTLFRVCSTAGVLFFNYFLLKHAEDRPGLICVISGVLYLISFVMLTLLVREGEYPPPPPVPTGSIYTRFLGTAQRYVRDCYSLAFYWKLYAFSFCFIVGLQSFQRFIVFYGREVTGGDLERLGRINSLRDVAQVAAFFLAGPLIDRLHPIRAGLLGVVSTLAVTAASFCFIRDARTFTLWVTTTYAMVALAQGSYAALLPRLFPRQEYGQFCSALAMLWHVGLMTLLPVCGRVLDVMGTRFIFPWFAAFLAGALIMLVLLYQDWKKLGGDTGYEPPLPAGSFAANARDALSLSNQ